MSRVFVVQETFRRDPETRTLVPDKDLTQAERYGTLVFVIPARPDFDTETVINHAHDKLRDFRADDYLLPVGGPQWIAAVGAIAADRADGKLKILKWDKDKTCYAVISMVLWDDD